MFWVELSPAHATRPKMRTCYVLLFFASASRTTCWFMRPDSSGSKQITTYPLAQIRVGIEMESSEISIPQIHGRCRCERGGGGLELLEKSFAELPQVDQSVKAARASAS